MNNRELFNAIMHYGDFDRMPVFHWSVWQETYKRWKKEGIPDVPGQAHDITVTDFLGAKPIHACAPVDVSLFPPFQEETMEETDEHRIFRQGDGVIAQHWKNKSGIPHFIDFTLKGPDWEKGWAEYKKRLQPDLKRIPKNFDEQIEKASKADVPVFASTGSMIGWIRNWVGVEGLAYLAYDNRDLLREMVDTITDLVLWGLDQVLPKMKVDLGWGWEDICFRTGPLLSPDIFHEVVTPNYRRIADKLLQHGCDLYLVDCDGFIEPLMPFWLEGGVNVMFPLEIGVWNADPVRLRKKFGKELKIFGGINKVEITKGRAAIDAEIERRIPLMKEGGFVPLPDHGIIPETSLEDYMYYLKRLGDLRF